MTVHNFVSVLLIYPMILCWVLRNAWTVRFQIDWSCFK